MRDANRNKLKISVKRAYVTAAPQDGYRVLVDRIWPRGRSKEALAIDQWARDLAPSSELRKWFGHDPKRGQVFQQRYRCELEADEKREQMCCLLAEVRDRTITLIFGAKDTEHNQALVLRDLLSHLHER